MIIINMNIERQDFDHAPANRSHIEAGFVVTV